MFENEETTVIPQKQIVPEVEVYEQKTAGFWMRFWAFFIDMLVISAVIGIVINPIFYLMDWSFDDYCLVYADFYYFSNCVLRIFCNFNEALESNNR